MVQGPFLICLSAELGEPGNTPLGDSEHDLNDLEVRDKGLLNHAGKLGV